MGNKLFFVSFVIFLIISSNVYAFSFQDITNFFTPIFNSMISFFNSAFSLLIPKPTQSGGGGGGGGGGGSPSPPTCSSGMSLAITGIDTCTVTATITTQNCDGKSYSINDDVSTKCSGNIIGNTTSINCDWAVSSGSYTYNLYVDGTYRTSKSVTCSKTPPKCSDGTLYGQCSPNKPKYCDNGNLIDKCTQCGCPSDQSCNSTTGSCYLKCSDGTPYGSCSSTKPKYCDNGILNDKCIQCNCPSGQSCNTTDNKCYPSCSDGTFYGKCSATNPKYCNNGDLINKCSVCGCPSGQNCNTDGSCSSSTNHLFYIVYHDILVDSNGHPNNNANRIANAHPTYVHTYAEISGNNIPQEVRDLMHNKGVKILCYVKSAPPDSTSQPFADSQIRPEIKSSMDLGCDGIMFDNVRKQFNLYNDTYKGWRDYVKTWGNDKVVWFNTGHSDMDESIMQVADIVEVEHHIDDLVRDSPWVTKYPSTRFAANVVSWEDLNYYPLPSGEATNDSANKVTLEKAIQYTNDCWNAGHIAYMYSGNINNSIGWLPTWFESYVNSLSY